MPVPNDMPRMGRWWDDTQKKWHYANLDDKTYTPDHTHIESYDYETLDPLALTGNRAIYVSNNFHIAELVCKCGCGYYYHNEIFLYQVLQPFRSRYGKPMIITSGCRCSEHNRNEGGSPTSDHLSLFGVDVQSLSASSKFELVKSGIQTFDRIGLGNTFVHLGIHAGRSGIARDVMWKY